MGLGKGVGDGEGNDHLEWAGAWLLGFCVEPEGGGEEAPHLGPLLPPGSGLLWAVGLLAASAPGTAHPCLSPCPAGPDGSGSRKATEVERANVA